MIRRPLPTGPVPAADQFHHRARRRAAQDRKAYAGLIASPFDLGSAAAGSDLPNDLVLPAKARLAIASDAETAQGDLLVTVNGVARTIPGAAADVIQRLSFYERGRTLTVSGDAGATPGSVTLYVLDEWMRPHPIATGEVTA